MEFLDSFNKYHLDVKNFRAEPVEDLHVGSMCYYHLLKNIQNVSEILKLTLLNTYFLIQNFIIKHQHQQQQHQPHSQEPPPDSPNHE